MIHSLVLLLTFTDFKVAVIGDTQGKTSTLNYLTSKIRQGKYDLAVHLGDYHDCRSYTAWKRKRKRFLWANKKWLWVIGNHEKVKCGLPTRFHLWRKSRSEWVKFWYDDSGDTMRIHRMQNKTLIAFDSASAFAQNVTRLEKTLNLSSKRSVLLFTHRPLPTRKSFRVGRRWYSQLDGLHFHGVNRKLWRIVKQHKDKFLGIFHGHHHGYLHYKYEGIPTWCTGGGGGILNSRKEFYHFLSVSVGQTLKVKIVR